MKPCRERYLEIKNSKELTEQLLAKEEKLFIEELFEKRLIELNRSGVDVSNGCIFP